MARINPVFKSPLYSNPNRSTTNVFTPISQSPAKKPKSISIPIRFVDSSKVVSNVDPSSTAIEIQRIFRGYLVRKNLKTVKKIEEEVNEIELKYKSGEEMERIVMDEKERIKVGEMLMRFLFRLDSVRGVREYRKKVIGRIISIQEMLDSIANKNTEPQDEEIKSVIMEEANAVSDQNAKTEEIECAESNEAVNVLENNNHVDGGKNFCDVDEEMKMADSSDSNEKEVNACAGNVVESMDRNAETNDEDKNDEMISENENDNKIEKPRIDSEKVRMKDEIKLENLTRENDNDNKKQKVEDLNEKLKTENDKMKSIMENIMMENEKLRDLVAELCAERVENLEKTVNKMKMKRKDKKRK